MKRLSALGLIFVLILTAASCGGSNTQTSPASTVASASETSTPAKETTVTSVKETVADPEPVAEEAPDFNPWGDKVFTKDEVNAQIDKGLSTEWDNYMINAVIFNIYNLPDNVLATLEAAFGAYKWESWVKPDFAGNWKEYFTEVMPEADKIHAVLDLYGITPDSFAVKDSLDTINKGLAQNSQISASQYATYEDGDSFFPFFDEFGCEVLAENDLIKIEGVKDITVDWYEDIGRVARITNVSNGSVYVDYSFIDCSGQGDVNKCIKALRALPEYEPEYDKISTLMDDETVLGFTPKDILKPGETTYLRVDYGKHTNFNTHWYIKAYPAKESYLKDLTAGEKKANDAKAQIRTREKSRDITLILKNRVRPREEMPVEYATIKGTLYNSDGEPLSFMPFRLMGLDITSSNSSSIIGTKECITSVDGSFSIDVPVIRYKTDGSYARYTIFVDGEKAIIDGKMTTMVIGELYAVDDVIQEDMKYSDYILGHRIYGQACAYVQPTDAKEYDLTIVVPDKLDYLVYDYFSETDYGGQANYYDYGGDVIATVKFHDETPGAHKTAYLSVFNHDGELILRKPTGLQTCCVCVSPDGSLVGTTITPSAVASTIMDFENPPANVGKATIFDLNGNVVLELDTGTRAMEISHDNKYVALDITGSDVVGVMEIATMKVIWADYRGAQIRHLIFSEDDSVLYMGSQECIAAYDAKTGEMLWQTFIAAGFPIDMVMSSKYLFASGKATGGNDNKLACINRKTGEMVWTFQTGSRGTKLTVSPDESMLFWGNDTGARDMGFYMLNANTGDPLWSLNYGGQAAWFTSDSEYVAVKAYGILEVYDRNGMRVATTACGSTSKMSWFVYIKDDLSRILNIAGGGDTSNSGWLYNMVLTKGYDRDYIDSQR